MAATGPDGAQSGFPLTDIDRQILAMRDEDFHRMTWDELKHIIQVTNSLELLKRSPSDLKRYIAWSSATKQSYGSITNFILRERLHWTPQDASAPVPTFECQNHTAFADSRDYQILLNDWPYGLAGGVVHIVVWTKAMIEVDPDRGDVTTASRSLIEDFVTHKFVDALILSGVDVAAAKDRVMWFKNWVSLQSVRGVDHVHVLVKDPPADVLKGWLVRTS